MPARSITSFRRHDSSSAARRSDAQQIPPSADGRSACRTIRATHLGPDGWPDGIPSASGSIWQRWRPLPGGVGATGAQPRAGPSGASVAASTGPRAKTGRSGAAKTAAAPPPCHGEPARLRRPVRAIVARRGRPDARLVVRRFPAGGGDEAARPSGRRCLVCCALRAGGAGRSRLSDCRRGEALSAADADPRRRG